MRKILLPAPPSPDDPQYRNPLAYNRAVHTWMQRTRDRLEEAGRINASPVGQAFVATSFTTSTVVSGTTTGTDLANVVATLVEVLTEKGILSPTVSRSG